VNAPHTLPVLQCSTCCCNASFETYSAFVKHLKSSGHIQKRNRECDENPEEWYNLRLCDDFNTMMNFKVSALFKLKAKVLRKLGEPRRDFSDHHMDHVLIQNILDPMYVLVRSNASFEFLQIWLQATLHRMVWKKNVLTFSERDGSLLVCTLTAERWVVWVRLLKVRLDDKIKAQCSFGCLWHPSLSPITDTKPITTHQPLCYSYHFSPEIARRAKAGRMKAA
jgi:hypothetical protein